MVILLTDICKMCESGLYPQGVEIYLYHHAEKMHPALKKQQQNNNNIIYKK